MDCSASKNVPSGFKKCSIFTLFAGKDPDNVLGVCAALGPTYNQRVKNPMKAELPDPKPNGQRLILPTGKTNASQLSGPKPGFPPNSTRITEVCTEIPKVESMADETALQKMYYKQLVDFEKEYRSCYEGMKALVQKLRPELDIEAMMKRAELEAESVSASNLFGYGRDVVSSDTSFDSGVYVDLHAYNGPESAIGGLEKVERASKPNILEQETIVQLSELQEEDEAENQRIISGIRMCFSGPEAEEQLEMMGLLKGNKSDTMLELSDEEIFKDDAEQERRIQTMQDELLLLEENVGKLEERNESSLELLTGQMRKICPNRYNDEELLCLLVNPDDLKEEIDFLELDSADIAKSTEDTPLGSEPEPVEHNQLLLEDSLTLAHRPSGGQGILENTPALPQPSVGSSKAPIGIESQGRGKVPKLESPAGRIPLNRMSAKKTPTPDRRPKWNQHEVKVIVRDRQPKVYRCPALPAAARPQEWEAK